MDLWVKAFGEITDGCRVNAAVGCYAVGGWGEGEKAGRGGGGGGGGELEVSKIVDEKVDLCHQRAQAGVNMPGGGGGGGGGRWSEGVEG